MNRRCTGTEARRSHLPMKVYALPDEAATIRANASNAGMSVSRFLLKVGQGYEPYSVFDHDIVSDLIKLGSDQARFGNLLKLWLANDLRLRQMDSGQLLAAVECALIKSRAIQDEIHSKLTEVLSGRRRK